MLHLYSTFSITICSLQNFAGDFWPGCIEQFTIFETKFEGATNLRILENRPEHKKNFNWKQVKGAIIKL